MRYAHIRQSDLSFLLSLQILIQERNITKAAREMFLSQPAMSRLFGRLREMFGDELLVRTGREYQPTRRALQLYAQLQELLPRLEELLRVTEFRPAEATDLFRITMTDNVMGFLSSKLVEISSRIAPGVQFQISAWDEEAFRCIEINQLDLALGIADAPRSLRREPLFREQFVCLLRKGHPFGKARLTLQHYLDLQHVVISLAGGRQGLVDQALRPLRRQRNVRVTVPYFGLVAAIIECTDMIATVPRRVAERLVKISRTQIVPAPIALGEFTCIQVWHPRYDSDPAHRWLRELIKKISQSV